jgi:predicted DNA binding CopG/RHH family protein
MKKAVQYFSDEYLLQCREMSHEDIVEFLEGFRELHAGPGTEDRTKSKLISMKIPENLLAAFRTKAELEGVPYQAQIKKLMKQWLLGT